MKNIAVAQRVKVSADGHGVVSHAGMGMVGELADLTGLSAPGHGGISRCLQGFVDLGRTVFTGSGSYAGIASICSVPRPRPRRCGGLVDSRVDAAHLPKVRAARAAAQAAAWAAGAAPPAGQPLRVDFARPGRSCGSPTSTACG